MDGAGGGGPLPQTIPSGEQTVWVDVSRLIGAACDDLKDGELIHGENFSLFAAMSALEIMDPKMDSGMEKCGYHSLEEAIEDGVGPVPLSSDRTLDVQRCIDVMDHLLICEATWHRGHSLAQTVFSCIYLLKIERTSSHALLHSYCRIIQATCNVVVSAVSDARTHEEEDLFTMSYGLPLKGDGDEKCLSVLNSVEETLCRQLRACRTATSRKQLSEDIESLQPIADLEEGYCKALLGRLRFRKHFYHVLMCMRKPQGRGLELARKHIASCLSELASIHKSQEFLRSNAYGTHRDNIECGTTASGCQPLGFAASLNSRLLAPAPPRAIRFLTWKEALKYFEKLLHDLDTICSFHLDPQLEGVMHFVVQFQKCEPDLVARSHLQLLLIQDGKLYGRDPFYDVIIKALPMPEAIKNQEFQKQLRKNELVLQLGQLVVNLLKVLCTNTAWQRRKLGKILQDWSVIAIQLELACRQESGKTYKFSVDEDLWTIVSKHLVVWVDEQTYWIASRFLMLGFELDLYSPAEYCMVYWYMYVVFIRLLEKMQLRLVSNSVNAYYLHPAYHYAFELSYEDHLIAAFTRVVERLLRSPLDAADAIDQMKRFREGVGSFAEPSAIAGRDRIDAVRRKGKKKRELSKDVVKDFSPAILLLQCYISLAEGLAMMLATLGNVGGTFQMPSIFNTEQERFMQHFELLQKARIPDGVSYYLFKESVAHANISSVVKYHYFMDVQKIAVALRGSFSGEPDKLAELRQIEQVAEHNRIALNVINQVGASEPSLRVTFEFSYHPCFAVAVVKRS